MRRSTWRACVILAIVAIALPGCRASRSTRPMPPTNGLIVTDLVIGTGPRALNGDTLVTNYRGWLPDGSQFDTNRRPLWFILGAGQVLRGWDVGMVGARAGGVRRLDIPPDMAYGANGAPPIVPPNARLVYEVSLVEVRRSSMRP